MRIEKDTVEKWLRKHPHLRDDDARLVANIWRTQTKGIDSKKEFLALLAKGKITPSDSITRSRRKLQELYPELRGKLWNQRQGKQEDVIDQINNF